MNTRHVKTLTTYAVLTLILMSTLAGLLVALPIVKAQAGEITLSSENLHHYKVIEVRVNIPGLDAESVELVLTDAAGQPLELIDKGDNSIPNGRFKAYRIGVGVFYAYIGGPDVDLSINPAYPKVVENDAIVKLSSAPSPGAALYVVVLGYDISKGFTFNTVKPADVTLDRTEVPARRPTDFTVRLTITDQDLNLDPTKVDDLSSHPVTIDVTWISSTTGETKYKTVVKSDSNIKESKVNSGVFSFTFTVSEITPPDASLGPGDTFLLNVYSNVGLMSDDGKYLTVKLNVVYRYPEVAVYFTQQGITVSVKSPDDNVGTTSIDTLDPGKEITIKYGTTTCDVDGSDFKETAKNTGVFEYEIPVEWGSSTSLTCSPMKFVMGVDSKSFSISAKYLDITGSGTFTTKAPTVEVIKQSPVQVVLLVNDSDLNVDANSIDRLTAEIDPTNDIIKLKSGTLILYEIYFKNPDGTQLDIPNTYSSDPQFFETDFDSGLFKVVIQSQGLLKAGESYTIVITDHTGGYTVSVPVTITPIEVRLDRSTYPVNRDEDVVIHVTYIDDRRNTDAKTIDTVPAGTLKYKVVNPVTGNVVIGDTDVDALTETAPDSGVFTGIIKVSASKPEYIDAVVTVYVQGESTVKATATFKVYQLTPSDLKAEPTQINITGCFTITVNDPDANVDSESKDSVTVTVAATSKTAKETGVNTGVFTLTLCAGDVGAKPGSSITIKYQEKTPPLAPTATTFVGSEYDVTASVKVVSFSGRLELPKDWIGPYETLTFYITDPDLNMDPELAETKTELVRIAVEGLAITWTLNGAETDLNTGKFKIKLNLPYLLTGTNTPSPEDLAPYIGKKLTIVYVDEVDATGNKATVISTLTIKAVNAEIIVDKTAVNLDEVLKITIKNADIAQNPAADFRKVVIRSTTYPTGVTLYASEVESGVYEVSVTPVSLNDWILGAPQIPAKLGDTIEIVYEDPIATSGKKEIFSKTVMVGRFVEKPGKAESVTFVDVTTGQTVTPRVGREVFLTVALKNTDIVERSMTLIIVVRDPNGVAVARFAGSATLGAGASTNLSFGWTPIVSGSHSVEVYIVKSLADRTPMGEAASFTATVVA
ncbi:MAG: hypothetical protein QW116_04940 [Zestosphaera sp.]